MNDFTIIQGGMGIGVSGWLLAQAVSSMGQLGVVSGTSLDTVLARRLQLGDPGGHMRRALEHFPVPDIAQRVLDCYHVAGGIAADRPFKGVSMWSMHPSAASCELAVVANFAEVWLAKEGHDGPVGINFLEKIQLPTLSSLYGALLAGVDYVLMGAGIPREIPAVLDRLAQHLPASLKLHVEDAQPDDDYRVVFDPRQLFSTLCQPLKRPKFLPIVASATLAKHLLQKATGAVDGFVVEGATAGGHNAPPRGSLELNPRGEPVYGPRDHVNLAHMRGLGLPFWLAGSYGSPEKLRDALAEGASGIQVGTAFAFCRESGLAEDIKSRCLVEALAGRGEVVTDALASPTGFPFKVVQLEGTISEADVYADRQRRCDVGYLRQLFRREDGSLGARCPGEPVSHYLKKGGEQKDTIGRKCICNGLLATIGLAQRQADGYTEPPIVTAGDVLTFFSDFLDKGTTSYSAADVIRYMLGA